MQLMLPLPPLPSPPFPLPPPCIGPAPATNGCAQDALCVTTPLPSPLRLGHTQPRCLTCVPPTTITPINTTPTPPHPHPTPPEHIVAKAIRDGGIDAVIDHEGGFMCSRERSDVYSTHEPQAAFHARIAFCLDLHNDATKAMRFEPDAHRWASVG